VYNIFILLKVKLVNFEKHCARGVFFVIKTNNHSIHMFSHSRLLRYMTVYYIIWPFVTL